MYVDSPESHWIDGPVSLAWLIDDLAEVPDPADLHDVDSDSLCTLPPPPPSTSAGIPVCVFADSQCA